MPVIKDLTPSILSLIHDHTGFTTLSHSQVKTAPTASIATLTMDEKRLNAGTATAATTFITTPSTEITVPSTAVRVGRTALNMFVSTPMIVPSTCPRTGRICWMIGTTAAITC